MHATCCDNCGTRISPPEDAFRLHDPRGFSQDYELCSIECVSGTVTRLTNVVPAEAKGWTR